jgi:hypothetical protein
MKVTAQYNGDSAKCHRYLYKEDGVLVSIYLPFKIAGGKKPLQEVEIIVKGIVAKKQTRAEQEDAEHGK